MHGIIFLIAIMIGQGVEFERDPIGPSVICHRSFGCLSRLPPVAARDVWRLQEITNPLLKLGEFLMVVLLFRQPEIDMMFHVA